MSVSLVPTAIGGVQAAVSTTSQIASLLAGFQPKINGIDILTTLAKDIGGFVFDYIGEERLEAGTEITDHYSESNDFMQDHIAIKPTVILMRGFVAQQTFNRQSLLPFITALANSLTPVTPYIGKYSPGTAAAMFNAVNQTDQILQQLAQIQAVYGNITKLANQITNFPGAPTKIQQAYATLDALRTSGVLFNVVTPWAFFDGGLDREFNFHGQMMIEHMVMVSPEETRGWADIIVRLKEIRIAPSFSPVTVDNSRAPGASRTVSLGSISK